MSVTLRAALLLAFAAFGLSGLASTSASASEVKIGDIVVTHPWSRATPGRAPIGVGYVTITNNGKTADRLLGGSLDFAKRIEVHTMTMTKGVMAMRKLKDGIVIAPGQTISLSPSGDHLMIVGLTRPLKKGTPFKARLKFAKAGELTVTFKVEAIGAISHKDMTDGSMAGHGTKGHTKQTHAKQTTGKTGHGGSGSHPQ